MDNKVRIFENNFKKHESKISVIVKFDLDNVVKKIEEIMHFFHSEVLFKFHTAPVSATKINLKVCFEDGWNTKTRDIASTFERMKIKYFTSSVMESKKHEYELVQSFTIKLEAAKEAETNIGSLLSLAKFIQKNISDENKFFLSKEHKDNKSNPQFKENFKKAEEAIEKLFELYVEENGKNAWSKTSLLKAFGSIDKFKEMFEPYIPSTNEGDEFIIQLIDDIELDYNDTEINEKIDDEHLIFNVKKSFVERKMDKLCDLKKADKFKIANDVNNDYKYIESVDGTSIETNVNLVVGIIDSAPSENFKKYFGNTLEVIDYGEEIDGAGNSWLSKPDISPNGFSHGEFVSSLFINGDKLNDYDDGVGILKAKLFPILTNDIDLKKYRDRIEYIVENASEKIFILSSQAEIENDPKKSISDFSKFIDNLSKRFKVKFIVCGTNDNLISNDFSDFENMPINSTRYIHGPGDSLESFTVNSVGEFNNIIPASYSRKGFNNFLTLKPDLSYMGGDKGQKLIKGITNQSLVKCENGGTSYSAPLLARLYIGLILKGLNNLQAESLLINKAIVEMIEKGIDPNVIHGNGVPNNNLDELTSFKKNQYTLTTKGEIDDWKNREEKFPFITNDNNINENILVVTIVSDSEINHNFGVEAIRSCIEISTPNAPGTHIKASHKSSVIFKDEFYDSILSAGDGTLTEKELMELKGKWKNRFTFLIKNDDDAKRAKKNGIESIKLELKRSTRNETQPKPIEYGMTITVINTTQDLDFEMYDKALEEREWVRIREREEERNINS